MFGFGIPLPPPPLVPSAATAAAATLILSPPQTTSGGVLMSSSPGGVNPSSPLFGSIISQTGSHRTNRHGHKSHSFSLGVSSSVPPQSPLLGGTSGTGTGTTTPGFIRTHSSGGGIGGGGTGMRDMRPRTEWQLKRTINSLPAPVLSVTTAPLYRMRSSSQLSHTHAGGGGGGGAPLSSIVEHSTVIVAGLESRAVVIHPDGAISNLPSPAATNTTAPPAAASTASPASATPSTGPADPVAAATEPKKASIYTTKPSAAAFDSKDGTGWMSPRDTVLLSATTIHGFNMFTSQSKAAAEKAAAKKAAAAAQAAQIAAAHAIPPPVSEALRMLVFGSVRVHNSRAQLSAAAAAAAAAATAATDSSATGTDVTVASPARYNNEGELVPATTVAAAPQPHTAEELAHQKESEHTRCVQRTEAIQRLRAMDNRRALVTVNAFGHVSLQLLTHHSVQLAGQKKPQPKASIPSMLEKGVEFALTPSATGATGPEAKTPVPAPLTLSTPSFGPLDYRHTYRIASTPNSTNADPNALAAPSLGSICGAGRKVLSVRAMDMSDDGRDEIIVCCW